LEIDVADFHITTATTTTGISKNDKQMKKTSSDNYRELWLSLTGKIS